MALSETIELGESIRARSTARERISVTELARGSAWRSKLAACDIMEIVDRGNNAGWLLSDKGLAALLETITHFEAESERTQVAYIAELRANHTDWKSGDDLVAAVKAEAHTTLAQLEEAFRDA